MNITIKGTHLDLTASIKQYVEEKVGSLLKFIQATEAKVELERDQHHRTGLIFRSEITLIVGGKIMRAEASAEDVYAAVDLVLPKLKEQISKFKDKKNDLRRKGARLAKRKWA
ncbi:MAG: ribosomal subunit interface protein [Candidatus Doudnabacteria bacterium RIFCSPLOWO2_01_FULL_44_21]|uniref:Ribosomal subunit interface protein n=1 Tax=Candidatus Doudnabacteria bacterium RIFCSPLOWO2_01_FULL_44_21 TaxID=1817841 RepID=A0A1F5Q5D1_9BACT|nr:MAG: ribosomal subunit interface protein [Candidatus Doudnabacteria bacterium RIFCSPHIGHO2_02_FULL_43_13b]OGE97379.1 MAG: ribosomal subunit interface protein [Candidatus Doudnabacteria bacterium RIFCSPLOWO2_01_FULL_44_21]